MKKKMTTKRRNVLKKMGSAGALTTFGLANVRMVNAGSTVKYVGITYDPIRGQKTGNADATVVTTPSSFKGKLTLDQNSLKGKQTTIPLSLTAAKVNSLGELVGDAAEKRTVSDFKAQLGGELKRNGYALNIQLTNVQPGQISGIVSHTNYTDETTAFVLDKASRGSSKSIRKRLTQKAEEVSNDAKSAATTGGE